MGDDTEGNTAEINKVLTAHRMQLFKTGIRG